MHESSLKSFSVITNYVTQFESAFRELQKNIPFNVIERLSVEIVRAMGSELRDYHKPEHSLDVSKEQSPIARLAAIFHDCVYIQVDPTWRSTFKSHLKNFLPSEDFKLNAKSGFNIEENEVRKAIIVLFGMEQTEEVILGKGINEVLSTLVMEHMLSAHLTPKEILSVAACIEATIPFRKIDADGNTSADRLKSRLNKAASIIGDSFSEEEKNEIVDWCRGIVEKDLASFAAIKFNTFISNTWNVMNENNHSLRNTFFYVSEYRKAVYGVIPFLNSLDPDQMFWNSPDCLDYKTRDMVNYTQRNLKWGVSYLKVVGLSLSILEAVAMESGGDLPYETLVGPTRKSREHTPVSIGAFLSAKDYKVLDECEREIYLLLKNGRELRARFDRKECPLGTYIFQNLSKEKLEDLHLKALEMHSGKKSPRAFLSEIPEAELIEIIHALCRTSVIRAIQMKTLLSELTSKKVA